MSPNWEHAAILDNLPSLSSQKPEKIRNIRRFFVIIFAYVKDYQYLRTPPWLCQFPRSYVREMQPILQRRSEDMCFFRHAPSPTGWVPSEKSRGCCSTMRDLGFAQGAFCSTSDAALALPIPPKVRSQNAAYTPASLALFLKNTASPSEYAIHSSLL